LKDSVYLQVAKIGTFFFYKQLYRQVLYKIIDNMAVFLDKNALE